jgi:DNA repair protein RadC
MNIPLSESQRIHLLNTTDLYGVMQQILLREDKIGRDREHFWVVGLEPSARICFIELISLGSQKATIVEPMEVFSLALQKRAARVILCHNHPSGQLKPSAEDLDITDRLIQVGRIVKVPVVDHQIINTKTYLSFADIDLMRELRKSIKYVPSDALAQQIRAEFKTILDKREAEHVELIEAAQAQLKKEQKAKLRAERKAKKVQQEKIDLIKAMKAEGLPTATIAKISGLSLSELEQL